MIYTVTHNGRTYDEADIRLARALVFDAERRRVRAAPDIEAIANLWIPDDDLETAHGVG